ncbi:isoamyl alcohol oxidase [Stachybotrys elegans]|uniref:Isoamyl alcohol oxidase n=1 Tax=Stachybotrys elegans TaxID=80388 RepID=A0A8K0WTV0_9HYPO|nr:isoamyl alcohol oxidase [Stachybotrys elegans]
MTVLAFFLLLGVVSASSSDHLSRSSPAILNVPQSAWDSLRDKVSDRLHAGYPYGLPCYSSYQNATGIHADAANTDICATIQAGLLQSPTLVTDFGSYHSPSFGTCMATGEKCTLSPSIKENPMAGTCYQGSVPDYYVDVRSVEDIQATLAFADEHNLPVTIKNTGHNYQGRSAAPHTLGIWTFNMQPEILLDEDFTPEGCPASVGPVVTYGAGQMWGGVYDFLANTGYLIVAGTCPTVGAAGGWVQGGGHGPFTPTYGLGVDNTMQMKVVLPNGTFVTANRCHNQDIFFALRGGGGGTFGVVTEVTTKIHKDTSFTFASLGMALPVGAQAVTEIFVENALKWAEEGWGGYLGFGANNLTTFISITPKISVEEAEESLRPIYEYFESVSGGTIPFRKNITTLPSQYAFQNTPEARAFVQEGIGSMIVQSSRLVPKETFQSQESKKALVDALVERSQYGALLVTPYKYEVPDSDRPGGLGQSSVTPAWRQSPWHLVYQEFFDPADDQATAPDAVAGTFRGVSTAMDKIRAMTPNGGAYMNEGDTYEPDPVASFWGEENYSRLLKIKKELDPKNLLSCFKCYMWEFPAYPNEMELTAFDEAPQIQTIPNQ